MNEEGIFDLVIRVVQTVLARFRQIGFDRQIASLEEQRNNGKVFNLIGAEGQFTNGKMI